tara:strand:- start:398 stop:592 length:195 start_codon:yes stop_codon:yes gene_type:complete
MVMDSVHVTAVTITRVLRVDTITLKQLVFKVVGLILFVLVAFIAVVLESAKGVKDAHPMLMDVT